MFDTLEWWRWLVLALFFVGLGFVWWWTKRGELKLLIAGKKVEPRLKIVERRYLGPKSYILLVEVDGQSFLLSQTAAATAWQCLEKEASQARSKP